MFSLENRIKYGGALIAIGIAYAVANMVYEAGRVRTDPVGLTIGIAIFTWPLLYLVGCLLWALIVELGAALLKGWYHGAENFEVQFRIGKAKEEEEPRWPSLN